MDQRILAVLQRDAGLALETLGEKVGLARNAVWRRVWLADISAGIVMAEIKETTALPL